MTRGLITACLLLALLLTLIGTDAFFIDRAVDRMEGELRHLPVSIPPEEESGQRAVEEIRKTFDRHLFLFSISLPLDRTHCLEDAIEDVRTALAGESEEEYIKARQALSLSLSRFRGAALFSPLHIF